MCDNVTAKDAPIGRSSTWQYHLKLHLKWTFVTANFYTSFNVDLFISGARSRACFTIACETGTFM